MCKVAERGPHNVHACAATGNCMAEAPVADSCSTQERSDEASCSGREIDIDTQKPILFQASHAKLSYGHYGKLKCVFCMQCLFAFFAQDSEHELQLKIKEHADWAPGFVIQGLGAQTCSWSL